MATADQLLLGIALELDSSGFVKSVNVVDQNFKKLNQTVEGIGATSKKTADIFSSMQQVMFGFGIAGAGGRFLGFLNSASAMSRDYEIAWTRLAFKFQDGSEEIDKTKSRMTALNAEIQRLGILTEFSSVQTVEAADTLAGMGFSLEQVQGALEPLLNLTTIAAGTINVGQAAEIAASAMNKFGIETAQLPQVLDMFAKAGQIGTLEIENLPAFLNSISTTAQDMGSSSMDALGQVLALGTVLKKFGQQPAQVGNEIYGFIRKLKQLSKNELLGDMLGPNKAKAGSKGSRFIELMGGEEGLQKIFTAEGQMRDFAEVFPYMAERIDAAAQQGIPANALIQDLFSSQAGTVMQLFRQYQKLNADTGMSFAELADAIKGSTGIVKEQLKGLRGTAQQQMLEFKGVTEELTKNIGQAWTNVQTQLIQVGKPIMDFLLKLSNKFPQTFAILVNIGGMLGTIVSGLGSVAMMGGGIASMIAAGAGPMMLAALVIFGKILLVIGAIIAAGYALKKAYDANLGGFADAVDLWWRKISTVFTALEDILTDGFISSETFNLLEELGLAEFVAQVGGILYRAKEFFVGFYEGAIMPLVPVLSLIGNIFKSVFNVVLDILGQIFGLTFETAEAANFFSLGFWRGFGKVVGFVFGFIAAAMTKGMLIIGVALNTVMVGIKMVVTVVRAVLDLYGSVFGAIGSFFVDLFTVGPLEALSNLAGNMLEIGEAFFLNLWEGMKSGWAQLTGWFTDAMAWIRDHLPGSDAKIGPLSDLTASGAALPQTLAEGMQQGRSALGEATTGTASAMAPAGPTAISVNLGGIVIQAGSGQLDEATAQSFVERVATLLSERLEIEAARSYA